MNILILSTTSDFLLKNLWWIILVAILVIALIVVLVSILSKKKDDKPKAKVATKSEYLEALGGEDNIVDKELKGSRIVVKLVDYSKLNKEKLKEAGVTGFIEMSDKLTLVIKDKAEEAYQVIFGEEN